MRGTTLTQARMCVDSQRIFGFCFKVLTVWQDLVSERHGVGTRTSGVAVFLTICRILLGKSLPLSGLLSCLRRVGVGCQ